MLRQPRQRIHSAKAVKNCQNCRNWQTSLKLFSRRTESVSPNRFQSSIFGPAVAGLIPAIALHGSGSDLLGERKAEVLVGVDGCIEDADLVVEMGAGTASAL